MSTIWQDIEPYILSLMENSDVEVLERPWPVRDDTSTDMRTRGKHVRKSLPVAKTANSGTSVNGMSDWPENDITASFDESTVDMQLPHDDGFGGRAEMTEGLRPRGRHGKRDGEDLDDFDFQAVDPTSMADSFGADGHAADGQVHPGDAITSDADRDTDLARREEAASAASDEPRLSLGPRSPMESLRRGRARRESVENLKFRYIAGKVAGRDLVGRNGQVLIQRGEILTAENIHLAEQEGKLVELIVHMVIDDLGD